MRKTAALILVTVIAPIGICALASAQSSPARRTPILTNDDLRATGEAVRQPAESEPQPARRADPEAARGEIAWQRDLRRAFNLARAEGKLVVVDVYTDWCGWCKRMDKTIYSHPAVVALSSQQVFVKVNAEDRAQGQDFARQMGVSGYPTTIILDGQARVLHVEKGYIESAHDFLELFNKTRASWAH